MDYASDIDMDDQESRQRRRGGLSFLIVLIGTACLVAAWILSAGDPYGDLAHRVVEVRTSDGELPGDGAGPAADEERADQGPFGLLPDVLAADPDGDIAGLSDDEAFRQVVGSLPKAAGSHPAENGPRRGRLSSVARAPGAEALSSPPRMTVPVEEFATPLADTDDPGEVDLTRAQRQSVQRRLGMAGHDAGGTDGVFGPLTREAIAAYQEASGLRPTGEVDRATLNTLRAETDAEYTAWAESRRAVIASRSARGTRAIGGSRTGQDGCIRDAEGNIVGGSVSCSLRDFGTNLRDAFGGGQRGGAGFQAGADR